MSVAERTQGFGDPGDLCLELGSAVRLFHDVEQVPSMRSWHLVFVERIMRLNLLSLSLQL